jgi:DNA helicase-2/ATP-dependent DNA helicase PcrA
MPLTSLNTDQYRAATAPFGHILVIASAGTGKTSTIVARIGHLIQSGTLPHEILLLTFTNKAASEMVGRIAAKFGRDVAQKIEAGTFHAVAYRWLKKIGLPVVLKQPSELKMLFKTVYEKRVFFHIDHGTKPYGHAYLYDLFSLFANTGGDDFGAWIVEKNPEHEPYIDIYCDIIEEFGELKRTLGFVDFNDLLLMMRSRLRGGEVLGYKEVLVDEYQDTNPLQGSLIDAMGAGSLFCVGDYDQSIYAFNGADISIIGGFSTRYTDAQVYTLEKNYRSLSPILSLANKVIERNERIYPKKLEVMRTGEGVNPILLGYEELFGQYQGIAQRINESRRPNDQIAVLFRNNSSADGIEASLRELGIKCRRKGGVSFFEAKEVKALLDLVTLFVNPKDILALIHVLEYAQGVGASIAKDVCDALLLLGGGSLLEGLFNPDRSHVFPYERRTKNFSLGLFDDFAEVGSLSRFREFHFEEDFLSNPLLKHPKLSPEGANFIFMLYKTAKQLKSVSSPATLVSRLGASELFGMIQNLLAQRRGVRKDGSVDSDKVQEAKENIQRKVSLLVDLAKHYSDKNAFLNAMVLGGGELSEGEGVNLLSVHASKGLEFEEVYIIDMAEGRFPNRKLMAKGGSIDEERRLFYVALTRAKDILSLSFARYDKIKSVSYEPSIFLYEAGLLSGENSLM